MTRINSSTEKEYQDELLQEIKELKDTVRELAEKLENLQVTDTTGNKKKTSKYTTKVKKEGVFTVRKERGQGTGRTHW